MIINHKYKFIFLKTRKTAGTSLEIALSKFCNKGDVITPLPLKDEKIRQELGYLGKCNRKSVSFKRYSKLDFLKLIGTLHRKQFYNHAPAAHVRDCVDPEVWKTYFKFCFERGPYDKAISSYYWKTSEPRPTLNFFLNNIDVKMLSNWDIYTINDSVAVDYIASYENLAAELVNLQSKLGLPEPILMPNAKGANRKNKNHYSEVLSVDDRRRIELLCAKELKQFGFRWNQ